MQNCHFRPFAIWGKTVQGSLSSPAKLGNSVSKFSIGLPKWTIEIVLLRLFRFLFQLSSIIQAGWVEGRSRSRKSKMQIADKLLSLRGVLGCLKRLKNLRFCAMLKLRSSFSRVQESFLSFPIVGMCRFYFIFCACMQCGSFSSSVTLCLFKDFFKLLNIFSFRNSWTLPELFLEL